MDKRRYPPVVAPPVVVTSDVDHEKILAELREQACAVDGCRRRATFAIACLPLCRAHIDEVGRMFEELSS